MQSVPQGNEVKTQPMVWQNPNDGTVMVIVSNDFGISASQLIMDGSNNPQLSNATAASWLRMATVSLTARPWAVDRR